MDVLGFLSEREGVPKDCFQLANEMVRTADEQPMRQVVYRLRRQGLSIMLRDFQATRADLSAREKLGLRAYVIRLEGQSEGPWQCLTWEEPIRDRLSRLWAEEIWQFRQRLDQYVTQLQDVFLADFERPLAWDQVTPYEVDTGNWLVNSHAKKLHFGDVLAVICPRYLARDVQQHDEVLRRIRKWRTAYGGAFTYLRRYEPESLKQDIESFVPWLHPPWTA